MARFAFRFLSPPGSGGRLSTLIYHRVLRQPDPLFPEVPDAVRFETQMRWVRDWFNVLPLSEAVERLKHGALPERALSMTFDDGYADNEEIAAPILLRLGLHATFFIASGFLEGRNMWNDRVIEAIRSCAAGRVAFEALGLGVLDLSSAVARRAAIGRILDGIKHQRPEERAVSVERIEATCGAETRVRLMMRSEQVKRLVESGMDVGGHTVNHPILSRLSIEAAYAEIAGGKAALEAIVGRRVTLFAYPNGVPGRDYTAEHVQLVRACGFDAAVSTAWGVAREGADAFQLPRFTPWDRTRVRFAARLAQNLTRTRYAAA